MTDIEKVARAQEAVMQSDIVQRLLGRARFLRDVKNRIKSPELMEEAAAEITRLTEALRAADEREKGLREALDRIAHRDPWTDLDSPERIAKEALAALKGPSHD